MFFVARLRPVLPAFLLLLPFVNAKDESLCECLYTVSCCIPLTIFLNPVTSSVTYCAPPETLLIQQFDLAYFAKNSSILFNISAASVVSFYEVYNNCIPCE